MGYAAEMLRFFWFANARRDATSNALIPRTFLEFINERSVTGQDTFAALKIAHVLVRESLLLPQQHLGSIFGQSYWSAYSPADWEVEYSTYDFLTQGFQFIRSHFAGSVLPVIVETKDGDKSVGSAFVISGNKILTARHCIDESRSIAIRGLDLTCLSGGPVINRKGEVVGIITADLATLEGPDLLGFGVALSGKEIQGVLRDAQLENDRVRNVDFQVDADKVILA